MATSRINANVEQVNIPIEDKLPAAGKPFEIVRAKEQSNLPDVQSRIRMWMRSTAHFAVSVTDDAAARIRVLKEEHPGYVIAIAGLIGFTCGVALHLRRQRSEERR